MIDLVNSNIICLYHSGNWIVISSILLVHFPISRKLEVTYILSLWETNGFIWPLPSFKKPFHKEEIMKNYEKNVKET